MKIRMVKFILPIVLFSFLIISPALSYTSPGSYTGFVNDFAGILSSETKNQLEIKLSDFEKTESNEIAVVTIKSLNDDTIENYAEKLFQEWGIGKAKQDNGILLLIAPNDRQVRIEVGYGLEGALTDLESGQIIRNILIPAFQSNEFDQGISNAVDAILLGTKGEYTLGDINSVSSTGKFDMGGTILAIALFIFLVALIIFLSKKYGNNGGSSGSYNDSGSSSPSNYSGGSSDFGGGSSGGGGASGKW